MSGFRRSADRGRGHPVGPRHPGCRDSSGTPAMRNSLGTTWAVPTGGGTRLTLPLLGGKGSCRPCSSQGAAHLTHGSKPSCMQRRNDPARPTSPTRAHLHGRAPRPPRRPDTERSKTNPSALPAKRSTCRPRHTLDQYVTRPFHHKISSPQQESAVRTMGHPSAGFPAGRLLSLPSLQDHTNPRLAVHRQN